MRQPHRPPFSVARWKGTLAIAVFAGGLYVGGPVARADRAGETPGTSFSAARLPRAPRTWGFVGCSNTHDTIWGYQGVSDRELFWPASFGRDGDVHNLGAYDYHLEGQTLHKWSIDGNPIWRGFTRMIATYNRGQSPPVIWIQLCESVNRSDTGTFHVSTYQELVDLLHAIRTLAPASVLYLSTLDTWATDPGGAWLCTMENGIPPDPVDGLAHTRMLADRAVDEGLALAGPGTKDMPSLGPLTYTPPYIDVDDPTRCHPNGNPLHGPGLGSTFLGQQLASFFDSPRTMRSGSGP